MTAHLSDNWHYNVNEQYATHGDGYLAWVNVFLAAGWTVIQGSDGTTVTPSVAPTASEWNNANAWIHLRDPGGASGRDLVIQRTSSGQTTAIYIGKAGQAMTGGTGSTVPSSAGRFQILGTGGAGVSNFFATASLTSYRFHFAAKAVAGGTSGDVYPFWMMAINTNSTAAPTGFIIFDGVRSTADGTVGDADSEPWVCAVAATSFSSLRAWYKAGLTGEVQTSGAIGVEVTNWTGLNPYTGRDDLSPVFVYETTGGREQRKGLMEHAYGDSLIRGIYQVLSPSVEGESRLNVSAWSIPWPHNVSYGF
jgi:hypothetical protein